MNCPLEILKGELAEWKKALDHCLSTKNMEDYNTIKETKVHPLKNAIWLIELAIGNELRYKNNG